MNVNTYVSRILKSTLKSIIRTKTNSANIHKANTRYLGSSKSADNDATNGSEGSINFLKSIEPIKMAYASYESTIPSMASREPPVIIMHGLLGSKGNWSSICKTLHSKTNRKIIAVDARNHGDSPHTKDLSYNHLAVDIHALMSDLGIKKATLLGHSMGGRAMMFVALRYPEVVEKLIVVDISPVSVSPGLSTMPKYFEAMRSVDLEPNVPLSAARKLADKQLAKFVPDPGVRQFFLTNLVEADKGKYRWRVNLNSLTDNFHEIIGFPDIRETFSKPTLFIAGGDSDYIKPENEDLVLKVFPAAQFRYVSGAGHWVHADKPHDFISLASEFLVGPQLDA